MIKQLRPFYTDEELKQVYSRPYDHTQWPDHIMRVRYTIHVARWMAHRFDFVDVTDLSCGDGAIAKSLGLQHVTLGDYVHADHLDLIGPIEDSLPLIGMDNDLFILSETLEHVKDPVWVLDQIRERSKAIVLTTPIGEDNDHNPEHYWGWDRDDVEGLLRKVGFDPVIRSSFDPGYGYVFQVWGAI